MRETVVMKPGFVFILPSVVERNAKQKSEMNLAKFPNTASLEQVTNLIPVFKQQDVRHMEVDLTEVMWEHSYTLFSGTHEFMIWKQVWSFPPEDVGAEHIKMPCSERRDEF